MKIAVVGIGCRYPGANSATELFENILAGRRFFREIPPERWRLEDYYHPDRNHPDTTYCKQAAFIEGFEFNPAEFKIPQSTYRATDQAQWLALATAKQALEDANLHNIPTDTTAVILGNTLAGETSRAHTVRYRWPYARRVFDELLGELAFDPDTRATIMEKIEARYKYPFPPVNEDNLAGGLANTIAGRICNYFDLKGGGYTVDGACSSSLLSIQEACVGLESHLCDLALAGGVDISLDPFEMVGFAKVGALSDSDIRVYDARSSGFLPGEGCGIVVLKRLDDAMADKNRIYAVIRGVGYSSDGKGGITAPSVGGQSIAVDRAYYIAGYPFAEVELIEGHGTGTPLGDRTELTTFTEGLARHGADANHRCGIGSIKSIIGHTKAAAGVAGFIKAAMSVYYQVLPPTMGLKVPNPLFEKTSHLYPLIRGRKWESTKPLRAAVSSAGFGGINTHIALERHEGTKQRPKKILDVEYLMQSYQDSEVFLIAAEDESSLYERVKELSDVARRLCHAELVDLAVYCGNNLGDRHVRLAVVADTPAGLHEKFERVLRFLDQRRDGEHELVDHDAGIYLRRSYKTPRIAFLFPGQGSQYLSMGMRWKERYPGVARHWDDCDRITRAEFPEPLSSRVFKPKYWEARDRWREWNEALTDTRVAQPAIVAASMATAELLKYIGIEPDVALGHSLGEYAALWSSGALDKATTLQLVCERGRAMAPSDGNQGAMLSVADSPEAVRDLLAHVTGYAIISNFNTPTQTVVSGENAAIGELMKLCVRREIKCMPLPVSRAFHSKLVEPASKRLATALKKVKFNPMQHLVVSSMTGRFVAEEALLPGILTEQITSPVQYVAAVNSLLQEDIDTFIEVGPGTVLTGLTRRITEGREGCSVFSTDGGPLCDDFVAWNKLVGYMFACGAPLVINRLFENRFSRSFRLPYEAKFIASPCESPVPPLQLGLTTVEGAAAVRIAAQQPAPETARASPAGTAPGEQGWTEDAAFTLLQRYISEKFGYPQEMVARETRMLEDLNLDSIKSVEVVAEAMGRMKIKGDPTGMTGMMLGQIAEKLMQQLNPTGAGQTAPSAEPLSGDELPTWVRNFAARMVEEDLPAERHDLPKGNVLLAALAASPLVTALADALRAQGITVLTRIGAVELDTDASLSGCIVVAPRHVAGEISQIDAGQLDDRLFNAPKLLLASAQRLLKSVKQQGARNAFYCLVTQGDGTLNTGEQAPVHADYLAGGGFVRSLYLENRMLLTRVLDIHHALDPVAMAQVVMQELTHGDGHAEAGYSQPNARRVPRWFPCPASSLPRTAPPLAENDVVLVTGGAKGITAACARALARKFKVKLALAGSSAPPADVASSTDELAQSLALFAREGIEYRYYQCDITDDGAVRDLADRVKRDMGTVRGVVHAAGLNHPHRVEAVAFEEFKRILKPKMLGLANLLRTVPLDDLRLLVTFSSIIGVSGMPGNSDYAYANEWMNRLLARVRNTHPHIRCHGYNYSVWAEIGMGARLNTVENLRSMGIDAIPPDEGVKRFVDLLEREWPASDLVISARLGGLDTLRFAHTDKPAYRFLEKVLHHQPGVELVTEVFLDPTQDRYLGEHNYDGALLFPAVVGMEAMAQAATTCLSLPGDPPSGRPVLENLQFNRPIVVPDGGRQIRIYAQAGEPEEDGTRRVKVSIRSSLSGYDKDYFSGECVWYPRQSPLPKVKLSWPGGLSVNPAKSLYGTIFFQGPMFQNIVSFHDLSDKHCLAKVKVPPASSLYQSPNGYASLLDMAEVRDAFLHSVQLCVPNFKILPVGMEKVSVNGFNGGELYLSAVERSRSDSEFLYDLDVFDGSGQCVEQIHGYRCRIVDQYGDQKSLAMIWEIHKEATKKRGQAS